MAEIPLRLPESDRTGQKNSRGSRMVTFTFTVPKLIFSVLFMAIVLVWVFIFGIMLGRGHKPEKIVPELARVMPTPQPQGLAASAPGKNTVLAGQTQNATAAAQTRNATAAPQSKNATASLASQAPVAPAAASTGLLSPQELLYHDTLKGKATASPVPKTPTKPVPAAKPASTKTTAEAKAATAKPAPKAAKLDPKAAKPEVKNASVTQKTDDKKTKNTGEPVFNYVYQVAAFKDVPSAEAMRKKLQSAGISSRIEKDNDGGTTWYKLLTPFRGRPEDTRSLRQNLSNHGIARVILRSKTPVQ